MHHCASGGVQETGGPGVSAGEGDAVMMMMMMMMMMMIMMIMMQVQETQCEAGQQNIVTTCEVRRLS